MSTVSEEAQRYIDQGVAQVYGFQSADAYRSFRKASELDPGFAMAYWGMALALGTDVNYGIEVNRNQLAYDAIQRARSLAAGATPKEQDLIAALATRHSNEPHPDFGALNEAYAAAMTEGRRHVPRGRRCRHAVCSRRHVDELGQQFPHPFPQAQMEDTQDTVEVIETLESVLDRDPDHVGAIHLYIHVMEQSPNPSRALESAQRLKQLAPNAPHLVHMASHIYVHTGDHPSIMNINEDVFPQLEAYRERIGEADFFYVVEGSHERRFVVETLDDSGRRAEAVRKADELVEWVEPYLDEAPWLADNAAVPILTRVHFALWDELLDLPEPAGGPDRPTPTGFYHFGRALAFAATGRPTEATLERDALQQLRQQMPADLALGSNSLDEMLEIVQLVANARIARAQEDADTSITLLRDAVRIEDTLKYDIGYPILPFSFRENLGATLLLAGQPEEAAEIFEDDLERNPGNGRSWFGLAASLDAMGDNAGVLAAARSSATRGASPTRNSASMTSSERARSRGEARDVGSPTNSPAAAVTSPSPWANTSDSPAPIGAATSTGGWMPSALPTSDGTRSMTSLGHAGCPHHSSPGPPTDDLAT